jgi:hypothetical protein
LIAYRAKRGREGGMLGLALMRGTISALAAVFGSLGVFFVYFSFMRPEMAGYAVVFLGSASAIAWATSE